MGETCRLLATVWAAVFLLMIANDDYNLRGKVVELQQTEQKYKLIRKASKAVNSWEDKEDEIEKYLLIKKVIYDLSIGSH